MYDEYEIDYRKSFVVIFLIVLTIGFIINANIDPGPKTTSLELDLQDGLYYYSEAEEFYKGTTIKFDFDSQSTVNVIFVESRFFSKNNLTANLGVSHSSGTRLNFTSSTSLIFTAEYTAEYYIFIFDEMSPDSQIDLEMTIDSPPFAVTYIYQILKFFIFLIWFILIFSLYKDLKFLWRNFKHNWLGIDSPARTSEKTDDVIADLFGKRNNLDFDDGSEGLEGSESDGQK